MFIFENKNLPYLHTNIDNNFIGKILSAKMTKRKCSFKKILKLGMV